MTPEVSKEIQIIRHISKGAPRNPNLALGPGVVGMLALPSIAGKVVETRPGDADIEGVEGKMILFVLDSSTSMAKYQDAVTKGYNGLLDRMMDSTRARSTLIHTVDIYGRVISPVGLLDTAQRIDRGNYNPSSGGSTPLRDALINASAQIVHEIQRQFDSYKVINGIIMALTDGEENTSTHTVDQTRLVIESLRKNNSIIYIGAGVGQREKYLKQFGVIGIPERFVISGENVEEMFGLVGDVATTITDPSSFKALAIRGLPDRRIIKFTLGNF